jgi:hypothetical protein
MQRQTKTTFLLADSRRDHLKRIAIANKTTVTELLAEGADLVIAKYRRAFDKQELERRAREAAEMLRRGLYAGPSLSERIDEVVYRVPGKRRRRERAK